jgi:ABC-type glycerol-3-phosphate transport system substrate-binding protein
LIYRESKEIEAAWKFIRWVMTDLEANVQRFQQGNSFPAYRPAWKDERLLQPNAFFGDEPLGELLVSVAPDVPAVVMSPQRPKAVFLFQESFFSQVMYQQITPEQAVEQMKAILEKD